MFHRAGHVLRSVAYWTREGAYFRSVAFSCRTQSVFHRAGRFVRSRIALDVRGRVCRSAASFAYELAAQSKTQEEATSVLRLFRSAIF